MSTAQLVVVAGVVVFATIVQFAAGFGFSLTAVPLLALAAETRTASMIATSLSLITSGVQAWHFRHHVDRALAVRISLATLIGMPAGLALFAFADERVLRLILGVTVLAMVVLLARGLDLSGAGRRLDWGAGAVAGVLSTSLSTNGPPLVFLLHARRLEADPFRATIATIFTAAGVISLASRGALGGFTRPVVLGLIVSPLPLAAGIVAGIRLRRHVDGERFRRVVLALLTGAAISAIVAAAMG